MAVVRRVIDALFDAALRFGGEPHVAADWRPVQAIGILATFSGVFLSGSYAAVYAWFGEPLAAGLARQALPYHELARAGLYLIVPITVAALLNARLFSADRPLTFFYLAAYVVVGLGPSWVLWHQRAER